MDLSNFKIEAESKVLTSREEQERLIEQGQTEILGRKCLVFRTYEEASEYKYKNKGNF